MIRRLALLFLVFIFSISCRGQAYVMGIAQDSNALSKMTHTTMDSLVGGTRFFSNKQRSFYISRSLEHNNLTADFYLIILLCGFLGLIRTFHPKFFSDLWKAFINPTLGNGQLKQIIQSAVFPNILMNTFSSLVLGAYLFYVGGMYIDWRFSEIPPGIAAGMLILFAALLYLCKFLFLQFSGWIFQLKQAAEMYLYNVFLVNKILGMALLPFVIAFAFADPKWHSQICLVSLVLIILFFINRYFRSWRIAAPIFTRSRFHFFMYLCAFELLPMAVLLKIANQML